MNVYTLRLTNFQSRIGPFGSGSQPNTMVVAVFATEDLVKAALAERRVEASEQGHLVIKDHENGRGFTVSSTYGGMTFAPGSFSYTVDRVVSADAVILTKDEARALRAYVMGDHFEGRDIDTSIAKMNAVLDAAPAEKPST